MEKGAKAIAAFLISRVFYTLGPIEQAVGKGDKPLNLLCVVGYLPTFAD